MAKRTPKRTKKKEMNIPWIALAFLLFVILSISIYFRAQTGWLGSFLGGAIFRLFGVLTYAFPPLILALGATIAAERFHGKLRRTLLYLIGLFFLLLAFLGSQDLPEGTFNTVIGLSIERGVLPRGGGFFGGLMAYGLERFIGNIGILLCLVLVLFFFILHLFEVRLIEFLQMFFSWSEKGVQTAQKAGHALSSRAKAQREKRLLERKAARNEKTEHVDRIPVSAQPIETLEENEPQTVSILRYEEEHPLPRFDEEKTETVRRPVERAPSAPIRTEEVLEKKEPVSDFPRSMDGDQLSVEKLGLSVPSEQKAYRTPPMELLKTGKQGKGADEKQLRAQAEKIEETLRSFGIESQVVSILRGPTVTQFELKPQAGVKVSRITNLSDDLALALAAQEIRIEAPIPGKPYVGVEVPNVESDTVWLRDILQSDAFAKTKDAIPVALGKSIEGKSIIAKIAKMPHLLIAGATGSGKSVCINTIIMSILYKYSPDEVRLILVDPKVVELSVYNEIPHLMIPVVTDPKKAAKALFTLVKEMERRFRLFSQYSVRDIGGYRAQREIDENMENLPYIVLIIDELSDLMMVASKDVESHITRLAQMARACGIHLIIATQRPSVDVITGTIKANIPSRISFAVSSSIDSRTILDQTGAEKLLGKGDMLYYPSTVPKPRRIQGAFVSDQEVSQVVQYITDQNDVNYDAALISNIEEAAGSTDLSGDEEPRDQLMEEVLEFISHEETTSISGLQRRFRIGYARAGRIIDELEQMGAISPQDGAKPRQVYIHANEEGLNESAE